MPQEAESLALWWRGREGGWKMVSFLNLFAMREILASELILPSRAFSNLVI